MHTFRLKDVTEELPKFVLGGLIGVTSECTNDGLKGFDEDDGGFIH